MLNSLERAPLSVLKKALDSKFDSQWSTLEIETISLEFGEEFSELLRDKISILQLMELDHQFFYDDVMFFLHATHVINNSTADFDVIPIPTSLELAFAIASVQTIYTGTFSDPIRLTVTHVLNQEGYSEVVPPFTLVGVKPEDLSPGQTAQDTANKIAAISMYIKEMIRWPQ